MYTTLADGAGMQDGVPDGAGVGIQDGVGTPAGAGVGIDHGSDGAGAASMAEAGALAGAGEDSTILGAHPFMEVMQEYTTLTTEDITVTDMLMHTIAVAAITIT